ncbi:DNA polymerase III subunit gamma and tau [Mycetocola manganoxydans]|uniref:DNA-directed DNA polymerase n=1 Tax=Mycetocola manganoxydans TaxID=699879 RepID=A0A3L7A068_9MICO|nr:DNA polymerase III subunit gamma and tau [Mycetocola manganoxydans]RLP73464.1 DNA polymerase III subunit gamma and tau [Mycetocola manganoxydans]GHD41600.1 hypothetical protein GCM10008097_06490 [Mycetocola manganoxydans]
MVTALYRRYRPESFAELIGQSQVTDPLRTALRTNRVNHAYLFSGPRGCGKTTSARILARCLNCVEGPTDTPCGVCPSCVELSREGSGSLDVVEIDAASHNGVDDARDLRERAIFAPARDRYKIFILDEAHMVTPQGFNALLKIVEEPPEHIKFIFATTEPDKVIGTIRSRTHHYPFRLIPPAQMLEYVQTMCESENVKVEPGVLPLVVRAGGGSARDTLSLLDQLMAGSEGDTVDYERAVALLGYTHSALLDEVIDALSARDAGAAFSAVDRVIQTGQDPRRFVDDLLERLRDLIVVGATGGDAASVLRGIPQDELDHMAVQATGFGQAELSRTADIVNAALSEMTGATSPRLHLELMVARVLVPSMDDSARGALARVERLERRVGMSDAASTDAPPPAPAPAPSAQRSFDEPVEPAAARTARPEPVPTTTATAVPAPATPAPAAPITVRPLGPVTVQQLKDSWPEILERVAAAKRSAWLVAQTATVRAFSDDAVLRLSFPSAKDVDDFKQLQAGNGVSTIVRQAILDVLGVTVKFIAHVDSPGDTDAPGRGPASPPPGSPGSSGGPGTSGPAGGAGGSGAPASGGTQPAGGAAPAASTAGAPAASAPNQAAVTGPPSADATTRPAAGAQAPAGAASRVNAAPNNAAPNNGAQNNGARTAPAPAVAPPPAGGWHVVAIPTSDPSAPPAEDSATPAPAASGAPGVAPSVPTRTPTRGAPSDSDAPEPDDRDAPPPDDEPPYPDPLSDPAREPVAIGDVSGIIPPGRFLPPAGSAAGIRPGAAPGFIPPAGSPSSHASARPGTAPAPAPMGAPPAAPGGAAPASTAAAPGTRPAQHQEQQQRTDVAPDAPAADRRDAAASVAQDRPTARRTVHPAVNSRYGESVVRELLGASFIEEQQYTPPTRFNRD